MQPSVPRPRWPLSRRVRRDGLAARCAVAAAMHSHVRVCGSGVACSMLRQDAAFILTYAVRSGQVPRFAASEVAAPALPPRTLQASWPASAPPPTPPSLTSCPTRCALSFDIFVVTEF